MKITNILRAIVLSVGLIGIAGTALTQTPTPGKDVLKGCKPVDAKPADAAYIEVQVIRPKHNDPRHQAGLIIGLEVKGIEGADRTDAGRPDAKVMGVYACKFAGEDYTLFKTRLIGATDKYEVTTVLLPPTAKKGIIGSCSPAAEACYFGEFDGDFKKVIVLKPLEKPAPPAKPATDQPKKG